MSALHAIPPQVLERHIAVLAMNGAGKSYGVRATIVEPLLKQERRVCIIDPTGVHWGVRLDAKGREPSGLDAVIFGGPRGDFPVSDVHGEAVAEVIATSSRSTIIDTSDMTVGARTRFFAGFAETLLRRNRAPLHLIIDESHLFAPQGRVADPASAKMLHAANNLISLGRARGLRVVLISQRPAKLHKDSLTQAHSLIVMKLIAPQDRDAARAWIEGQPDAKRGEEVMASLAGLQTGHGWLWAPEIDVLSRISFPKITTFDSFRAPDDAVDAPFSLPALDTNDIKAKLEAVAAEVVANDPAALKKRIADLEAQIAQAPEADADLEQSRREAFAAEIAAAEQRGFERAAAVISELRAKVLKETMTISAAVQNLERYEPDIESGSPPALPHGADTPPRTRPPQRREPAATSGIKFGFAVNENPIPLASGRVEGRRITGHNNRVLTPAQLRIIDALAWQQSMGVTQCDRESLAFLAQASPKSSSYANNLGSLRTGGFVEYHGGKIALTDFGRRSARTPDRRLTHADIMRGVLDRLVPAQGRIITHVAKVYPRDIARPALAQAVGASATSSSFANNLGRLRSLGLIVYRDGGKVRADDRLYP